GGGPRNPGTPDRPLARLGAARRLPDRLCDRARDAGNGARLELFGLAGDGEGGEARSKAGQGLRPHLSSRQKAEGGQLSLTEPALSELAELIRLAEALLFASTEPLDEQLIATRLPEGADIKAVLEGLQRDYAGRGVTLERLGGRWVFRTAEDLA